MSKESLDIDNNRSKM